MVETPNTLAQPPLCVDLDGTLIASDMLWETMVRAMRERPTNLLRCGAWLCRGRAFLKARLAEQAKIDPATLPYRADVLEFLRDRKAAGQPLVLATASDRKIAQSIADHLGLFDDVIASDGALNCKGGAKLEAIRSRYPDGFDYMGDSAADLPLWRNVRHAYLVAPSASVRRRADRICTPARVFESPGSLLPALLKLLRPHQWVKNVLVFLPLLLAHQLKDLHRWVAVLLAFLAFSLCASSVYVINDLLDVEADRLHRSKRRRAFASGRVPLAYGPPLIVALLGATAGLCAFTPQRFGLALAVYFFLSLGYSLFWKARLLVDVMILAILYTMRILGGGAAANVLVSPWLLAFSIFLFLSLAFAKRYTELTALELAAEKKIKGRGYVVEDLRIIEGIGPASGYIAVMVLALYINGDSVSRFYPTPILLWMLCPLLLYWITRIWFMASRRYLEDDPIVFALKDKNSWYVVIVGALLIILASRHWNL